MGREGEGGEGGGVAWLVSGEGAGGRSILYMTWQGGQPARTQKHIVRGAGYLKGDF